MTYSNSLLAILIAVFSVVACERGQDNKVSVPAQSAITEMIIQDTQVGSGPVAEQNKHLTVHYTGWLYDASANQFHGKQFDSSRGDANNPAQPFSFYLGAGQVIPGWDQGMAGMKVGGKRTLIIPAALAYGPRGAGRGLIPGNATLVFEVELLAVN